MATNYYVNSQDLNTVFAPYISGPSAPVTNYYVNSQDLNTIFAPRLYTITNSNQYISFNYSNNVLVITTSNPGNQTYTDGTCQIKFSNLINEINYFMVGGGGAGCGSTFDPTNGNPIGPPGGGGAGGNYASGSFTNNSSQYYDIQIGSGGPYYHFQYTPSTYNGNSTTITGVNSVTGGGGANAGTGGTSNNGGNGGNGNPNGESSGYYGNSSNIITYTSPNNITYNIGGGGGGGGHPAYGTVNWDGNGGNGSGGAGGSASTMGTGNQHSGVGYGSGGGGSSFVNGTSYAGSSGLLILSWSFS